MNMFIPDFYFVFVLKTTVRITTPINRPPVAPPVSGHEEQKVTDPLEERVMLIMSDGSTHYTRKDAAQRGRVESTSFRVPS